MRMLMEVKLPLERFNTAVSNGTAGQMIGEILAAASNAKCQFRIAMTSDDMKKAGLEALGKK